MDQWGQRVRLATRWGRRREVLVDSQAERAPRRTTARGSWWLAALAALTVLLGLGVMVAPVVADDPVVTWPKAGEPATSPVLPLSPYRPLSFDAKIPCATLRA